MRAFVLLLVLGACRARGDADFTTDADGDGIPVALDCDDGSATTFPAADELCDGLDNDCDGEIDEAGGNDLVFYADTDGDGFGGGEPVAACVAPEGYLADGTDCDDTRDDVYPAAPEADCTDPVDYNCDGSAGLVDGDADGAPACLDCDDADRDVRPDAPELCNGVDDDCADGVDVDALDAATWYADTDDDGFGDPDASVRACEPPADHVADDADCDDVDEDVHPGAVEHCDDVDEDCDGDVDELPVDASAWFLDRDGDTYGDAAVAIAACDAPDGFVATSGDCDDASGAAHPGATEVCDGIDNDCADGADEAGAQGESTWYADSDGDGAGDPATAVLACAAPADHVGVAGDCDDDDATLNPSTAWYADADHDTFGAPVGPILRCTNPGGRVRDATDCHDGDAAIHPGATEVCNGADDDCDQATDDADGGVTGRPSWYADVDGDGYGASAPTVACVAAGVTNALDCNDADAAVNPDTLWYADVDGDTWGDAASTTASCLSPGTGWAARAGDCDDGRIAVNPDGTEVCNGRDDDCDHRSDLDDPDLVGTTWYLDADDDDHGLLASAVVRCAAPGPAWVTVAGDCDDADPTAYEGAPEACDDVDHDCDGDVGGDGDGDGLSDALCGGSDCDDSDPDLGGPGATGCPAAASCDAIQGTAADVGSGAYVIEPPGSGLGPVPVYCDMTTAGGGWTLVWKHAYLEVGTVHAGMRFFAGDYRPCTTTEGGWCNLPAKDQLGGTELRIRATHGGAVVYDYRGPLRSDIETAWSGAILAPGTKITDGCTTGNGLWPEPVSPATPWGAFPGITFDKATQGDYVSNCDTDAYLTTGQRPIDCRWENCQPGYTHSQMTVTMWVR